MPFARDRFAYDPATKTFTAFASDLGIAPGRFPRTIEIRNRTVATFAAVGPERWSDGEVYGFRYRQASGPCEALIFND